MFFRKFPMACLCLTLPLWLSGPALADAAKNRAAGVFDAAPEPLQNDEITVNQYGQLELLDNSYSPGGGASRIAPATTAQAHAATYGEIGKLSSRQLSTGIGRRITAIHNLKAKNGSDAPIASAAPATAAVFPSARPADQPVVTLDLPMPEPIFLGSSQAYPSVALASCSTRPHMRSWASAYGSWAKQNDRGTNEGFRYEEEGFVFGHDFEHGDVTMGLAAAIGSGTLDANSKLASTDVDTLQIGVYWSYDPVEGIFADLNVGAGYSWNRTDNSIASGLGNGKFRASSLFAGGNVGYTYTLDDLLRITPTIGLQWTQVHQSGWSEKTAANTAGNWYAQNDGNYVEIPLAVRASKGYEMLNGSIITPEVRAACILQVGDQTPTVRMGDSASGDATTIHGIDPGAARGLIGGGVKANFNACMDAFIDYNFEFRKGYRNSTLTTGLGLSF